jgi:hypothetical protein
LRKVTAQKGLWRHRWADGSHTFACRTKRVVPFLVPRIVCSVLMETEGFTEFYLLTLHVYRSVSAETRRNCVQIAVVIWDPIELMAR